MMEVNACTYGVYAEDGESPAPMDLRPFLDALAAAYDRCYPCVEHHTDRIAGNAALTTHVVGVSLCSLGLREASARQLLHHLDPAGAAVALTIRNSGLLSAVEVANRIGLGRRREMVRNALNQLLPLSWYDTPISNTCPTDGIRDTSGLGDEVALANLRADGVL